MASSTKKVTPPNSVIGSFPKDSPPSQVVSLRSVSQETKAEILKYIEEKRSACTWQGKSSWVFNKEDWNQLMIKLVQIMDDEQTHSIPPMELAELHRELGELRLKENDFKTLSEKKEFADSILRRDKENAEKSLADLKASNAKEIKALSQTKIELTKEQSALKENIKELNKQLAAAKSASDADLVEQLKAQKKLASELSNHLNTKQQELNSLIKIEKDKVAKYEKVIQQLNVELNLIKSQVAIQSGDPSASFAAVAKKAAKDNYNLVSNAWKYMSDHAKAKFAHAEQASPSDAKNLAFWLFATVDKLKHVAFKPYKKFLGGLMGDLKYFNYRSKQLFAPALLQVRDSLSPGGKLMTEDELNALLQDIPLDKIELKGAAFSAGYKTLADLHAAGKALDDFPDHDLPIEEDEDDGKLRLRKPPVDKGKEPAITPMSDDDDSNSYWLRTRNWFMSVFDNMNVRIRNSLRKRPARLARYYKWVHGNFFQKTLVPVYSWYIWLFP
ncbi:hypothetical protein [Corynespora cassiicola fusarivirus 1]|nr:hypothetical protein [Corynespora cassiicola fusarivirus 1]